MPAPTTEDRSKYVWCDPCAVYIPKKLVKTRNPMFADEAKYACPDGHPVAAADMEAGS